MASFWVDSDQILGSQLILRGDEAHHLHRVRRQGVGDVIDVIDGEGHLYSVRLVDIGRDRAVGEILSCVEEAGESPVRLVLAPVLLKGQRFDWVVEKVTEVGVAAIWPVLSERGVARAKSDGKVERWQRIVRAAVKQCGRSRCPELASAASFAAVVEELVETCDVVFMGALEQERKEKLDWSGVEQPRTVGLLVGPEGGFSTQEIENARRRGVRIFAWGERVLRADTASVVLSGLLLSECAQYIRNQG
jgi:16S rRNA (uracil1498-N3)-methyltransferase